VAHGHDVHFLERLERLSTPETELALSLYQDPVLIRALLEQLRLPEGAARVALSLGDGERGPFVVVARDGHFVTCLAEGMSPGDHPVIPRGAARRHRPSRHGDTVSLRRQKWHPEQAARVLRETQAANPAAEPKRVQAPPGRNETCPCGSGKKYKRCHGN
jgi:hypothetical protein